MKISEATILVVDDEPELCEIFSAWLSRSGCRVLTAQNGAEALAVIAAERVDAVISDIRMPVMDGVMLVRRLHELRSRVPSIIFVSGFGDIDPREVHHLGVEALITKPVARDQLLAALGNCLALRSELWLNPMKTPPSEALVIDIPNLKEAVATRTLQFGRGGFCVVHPRIVADCDIAFSIRLIEEAIELNGQGRVRWSVASCQCVGIEFVYLDPASRSYVLRLIAEEENFSFIPRC